MADICVFNRLQSVTSLHIHTHSAPVPFDVLPDSVSERKEDFRLTLIPQLENPSDNFRLIPDRNTQIFILDDDGNSFYILHFH